MRVAVVGAGYVGLVSGACLAEFGHDVVCVDKDTDKVRLLERAKFPSLNRAYEKSSKPMSRLGGCRSRRRLKIHARPTQFLSQWVHPRGEGMATLT